MPADGLTVDQRRDEVARILAKGLRLLLAEERREAEQAVAEGRASWLIRPTASPPTLTEEELRKRPRYRGSRRDA